MSKAKTKVKNENEALDRARNSINSGDFNILDLNIKGKIKTEDLESAKNSVNVVSEKIINKLG